jgi:hypothetical protein
MYGTAASAALTARAYDATWSRFRGGGRMAEWTFRYEAYASSWRRACGEEMGQNVLLTNETFAGGSETADAIVDGERGLRGRLHVKGWETYDLCVVAHPVVWCVEL